MVAIMMGAEKKGKSKLFYYDFSLEKRVPRDHVLRRISEKIDFGFVRRSVADSYGYNGHQSEDPIVIIKLMFLLFFEDVKSERRLMRDLPMRLDWLWFLNPDLDSEIPDHSILSKARKRWGREVFEELFVEVVRQCLEAGLVQGSKIYLDGSLVDANVSKESVSLERAGETAHPGSIDCHLSESADSLPPRVDAVSAGVLPGNRTPQSPFSGLFSAFWGQNRLSKARLSFPIAPSPRVTNPDFPADSFI
jgi:transposase